jgi:hypothetical protein
VDLGGAVVADKQASALVEPGEGAFDDPAVFSEPGPMLGLSASDHGLDSALAELTAVAVVVVAAVSDDAVGTAAGSPGATSNGRDQIEERDQLSDVVTVPAGQRPRQRRAMAVCQEVMLRAWTAPVDRARADFAAPFFAWI